MGKVQSLVLIMVVVLGGIYPSQAAACPLVGRFVDYNCDQLYKIAFVGDSIVVGVGDSLYGSHGGYPLRIQKRFSTSRVVNLGVPGVTSLRLYQLLASGLRPGTPSPLKAQLRSADIIVIDVGRNDYWQKVPPGMVVRNIFRIAGLLRSQLFKNGVAPLVVVATMIPNARSCQAPYVSEINSLLLRYRFPHLPGYLRFDRDMSTSLLGGDGLHPTSAGYERMAKIAAHYLTHEAQEWSMRHRPDMDADGVYDLFEKKKFKTDPNRPDTDGDGYVDGEELFVLHTDPLDALNPTPTPTPESQEN